MLFVVCEICCSDQNTSAISYNIQQDNDREAFTCWLRGCGHQTLTGESPLLLQNHNHNHPHLIRGEPEMQSEVNTPSPNADSISNEVEIHSGVGQADISQDAYCAFGKLKEILRRRNSTGGL